MVIKKTVSEYKRGKSFGYRINISKSDNLAKDDKVTILRDSEYKTLNKNIANHEKTINKLNQKIKKINEEVLSHEETKIDLEDAKKEIDTLNKDIEKLIVEKNELLKKVSNYKALQESNKELEKKLHESKSYKPQIEALNETVTNLKLKLKEHETNDKNIDQMERLYKATLEKVTKQQDEIIKELNQQFHNQTKKNNDEFNEKIEKYLLVNIRQNEALKQIIDLSFFDLIRNKHKKVANKNIEKIDSPIYELTPKK